MVSYDMNHTDPVIIHFRFRTITYSS